MNETIYSEDWRHLLEHGILKIVLGSHLEIDNKTLLMQTPHTLDKNMKKQNWY